MIEIVPGSEGGKPLQEGDWVKTVNPPRFDQLISGSFDLAEKILNILDENDEDLRAIVGNIRDMTDGLASLTSKSDIGKQ